MTDIWDHPKLGRFKYEAMGWTKLVDLPAFKAFSYDTGYENAPRSKGKHRLIFAASGDTDFPSAAAVLVAEKVLANHAKLVTAVTDALWDDFNGRGPGSGMWWRGNLDAVAKSFAYDKQPAPAKPADLLPAMQASAIVVREPFPGDDAPLIELQFHCAFEEEHGVSVLTDGESVRGIGHPLEVTPFGFKPPKRMSFD